MKVTSLKLSRVDQGELTFTEQIPIDIEYSDVVSRDEDIDIDPVEPIQGMVRIQECMWPRVGMNLNIMPRQVLMTLRVANRQLSEPDSDKSGYLGKEDVAENGSCMDFFILEQPVTEKNLTESAIIT